MSELIQLTMLVLLAKFARIAVGLSIFGVGDMPDNTSPFLTLNECI